MNQRQRKTIEKIYDTPTRADIAWNEVRALLTACKAQIREGRGSRISITFKNQILNLHSPHPQKELKKYAVELIREFLMNAGVKP